MNTQFYGFSLITLTLLDILITAVQASLLMARKARLNMLEENEEAVVGPTLEFMESTPHLRLKLTAGHAFVRLILFSFGLLAFLLLDLTAPWFPGLLYGALVAGITLILLEALVETFIAQNPEIWALRLTSPARFLIALLSPFWVLPVLFLRGIERDTEDAVNAKEDELMTLLEATQEDGGLEEDERDMIRSVFQLRETTVREIMVPRPDMQALNVTTPLSEAMDRMLETGYSRIPVYEESVDRTIGILYVKDLLRLCREGYQAGTLHELIRPPYFVPESKMVTDLLEDMQRQRIHIAIVVDEYGGVAGLVTLEDIVEELVGEIQDEYDKAEEEMYQVLEDGSLLVHARMDLDDFNELLDSDLPGDDADTLAGLIYSLIGQIPKGGEVVEMEGLRFTVEQVLGRRIRKVRVQHIMPTSALKEIPPDDHE